MPNDRKLRSDMTEADIQEIAMTLNLRPRKCLGFRSPVEAFLAELEWIDGEQIGIIGLGLMGGSYARNLSKGGCEVIGCDIDPARIAALADCGVIGVRDSRLARPKPPSNRISPSSMTTTAAPGDSPVE